MRAFLPRRLELTVIVRKLGVINTNRVELGVNTSALKSKNFRRYLVGSLCGLIAVWMNRVTLSWLAWEITGSASFVGLVAMASFAPTLLLAPVFGVFVDRINVKRTMIVVQLVRALGILAAFITVHWDLLTTEILLSIALWGGITSAATHTTRASLTPRLVTRDLIPSVVNFVALSVNTARIVGPALAGLFIAKAGMDMALLFQVLLFVPFLVALVGLQVRETCRQTHVVEGFATSLKQGFGYVLNNRVILRTFVLAVIMSVAGRGALEMLPPIVDGIFERGAMGLSTVLTISGFGALFGGLTKLILPPQKQGHLSGFACFVILIGLFSVILLGLAPVWGVVIAAAAGISFANTFTTISVQTAVQLEIDDAIRGRVLSIYSLITNGAPSIGAGFLGYASLALGVQSAIQWMGIVFIFLVLVLMFYLPRTRLVTT